VIEGTVLASREEIIGEIEREEQRIADLRAEVDRRSRRIMALRSELVLSCINQSNIS
jgi:hypothetical protein